MYIEGSELTKKRDAWEQVAKNNVELKMYRTNSNWKGKKLVKDHFEADTRIVLRIPLIRQEDREPKQPQALQNTKSGNISFEVKWMSCFSAKLTYV